MENFTLKKNDIIEGIVTESNGVLDRKHAECAYDAIVSLFTKQMVAGNTIPVTGFGKFSVKRKEEREGINPRTKEKVVYPAKNVPVFKAFTSLKDALNKE